MKRKKMKFYAEALCLISSIINTTLKIEGVLDETDRFEKNVLSILSVIAGFMLYMKRDLEVRYEKILRSMFSMD